MPDPIEVRRDLLEVDWAALKAALREDRFDNGRTADELQRSFEASAHTALVWESGSVIGTARLLSDGICNAYLVDVWTRSSHRRRGVASALVRDLVGRVPGQHIGLFTDDRLAFYRGLGFEVEPTGMSLVSGSWLNRD